MARIELAPDVIDDFDRFFDLVQQHAIDDAPARIDERVHAIQLLTNSPLIGGKLRGGKLRVGRRELVVGREARGHVALYRCINDLDMVFVLAVRSECEQRSKR